MTTQSTLEINPAFRLHKVQAVIVELWQSSTTSDWQATVASLITLLKIAEHEFFDDLIFLIDMAGERQAMAHRKEMEAQEVTL
ncbi:hypothetical protein [Leucothrix mucor]|uniref:hypothetical protein n=1 Tax=Leucothrix mucor TaxID=45248 RepID=UPI0003B77C41|nr:hypothetical protein [Leucothrix mucor]